MHRDFDTPRFRVIYAVVLALFFASGFCGLVYQVVWLRMAFAHFGIVTPVLSVVVSTFMLGLGLGSLAAGRWGAKIAASLRVSPAVVYAAAELCIAIGAVAVPATFAWGERMLLRLDNPSSAGYLFASALIIVVAMLPWCTMMGATFPLMMGFIRAMQPAEGRSFSYLYLGNVAGAAAGTLASAGFLIELFGFRETSYIAAAVNVAIALASVAIGWRVRSAPVEKPVERSASGAVPGGAGRRIAVVLFTTGFCALAMEVVWVRGFTIVLKTSIYAFAAILAMYLLSTWLGTSLYRRDAARGTVPSDNVILFWAAITAVIPALLDDPRIQMTPVGVLLSILPFCAVLGFLTPKLMDDYSGGDAGRAGRAYAVNIAGGILGPLVAGYALVTLFDIRVCLVLLALPIAVLSAWSWLTSGGRRSQNVVRAFVPFVPLLCGLFVSQSYEGYVHGGGPREVRRDYVATAIAYGTGFDRGLLVNGVGITSLTPITKDMAHLTLATQGHAKRGLVICFGMGTTFRSMASWGIDTTVVDLTSSVTQLFGFFHSDAPSILANPHNHVVVDDGRRYLLRTDKTFDVILLDPPPPTEAAGSSLLYSKQFYEVAKRRLSRDGILQQWLPDTERATVEAVVRTVTQEFPHVVVFNSIEGWGYHILASEEPIPNLTPEQFVARMPARARADMVEWGPEKTPLGMARAILSHRIPLASVLPPGPGPIVTDDRPYNEYFLVRRSRAPHAQ